MRVVHVMSVLLLYSRSSLALKFNQRTKGYGAVAKFVGRSPMELSPEVTRFARSRPVIECAQCGERLYIPEWSECLDGCRVRHLWQCDSCGTSFETTVRFAAA
jgi:hypothetical protein